MDRTIAITNRLQQMMFFSPKAYFADIFIHYLQKAKEMTAVVF